MKRLLRWLVPMLAIATIAGAQSGITRGYAGGTCTNQAVTAVSANGAPTCTSLTSAYVSGTTGTGNFVLATTPTLVTPVLGAATGTSLQVSSPQITAGSGTGVTVDNAGELRSVVYKLSVLRTNFICAALTCDFTVATLPAKTFVQHAIVDLTTAFACSATCTSTTLSATLGKTAGGNQYLVSFDADAATGQFGDAAAELGTSLAPATMPTEIGDLASWTATTNVVLRMTSGTGNIGTGAATNFSTGAITVYLTTTKAP